MTARLVLRILAGLAVAAGACGGSTIHPLAYTPQPERIEHPERTLATLIVANTVQGCVSEPSYAEPIFVVKFICNDGGGNVVLRTDQIASIELLHSASWYRVRVRHSRGAEDFVWDSKSLDDAQHIADAIAGLARHTPAPQPAPSITAI
jgi:hypothetical protein